MKRNTTRRDRHRRIIAKGKPRCAINGCDIDYNAHWLAPNAFQVDHIIPLDMGGTDTLENKQPSCRACNRAKSNKIPLPAGATYVTERRWA